MPAPNSVEDLLARYPEDVQEVALAAREFVRGALPDAEETVDGPANLLGYQYGPGYKGLICTLMMSSTGVKLGIVRGAELSDPRGLMAGSGKVHRHVPLSHVTDLKQPGLKQLLKAALAAWRRRSAESTS